MNRRSAKYQEAVEQGFDEEFEAKFFAWSVRDSKIESGKIEGERVPFNDDPWPAQNTNPEDEFPF